MSKKLLALLLAMIMIVGSFTSVLAETTTPADDKKAEEVKTEDKKDEKSEEKKDEKSEEKTEEKTEEKKEEEPVKDEALERAIKVLKKAGFITGYSADSDDFKVEKNVKRSEFASMIVRAKNLEKSAEALKTVPTGFKDVPTNHWANGYIAVAKQQGFVNGYTDGTFRPDRQISYQDMATMLTIALGQAEVGTVYPAGYIVKAQQLGLFNDVKVPAYTDMATRGDVFKMLYNMINCKEFGERKIDKAIVLENSRVEKMNDDEIVVEVIKPVQEANWVGATRSKRGDQHKYKLDKELMRDPEELLGKVIDITTDKDNNVIEINVDKTYDYVEGKIVDVNSKKFELNGDRRYTALFDERYDNEDERIYRTYLNNKDYKYEDFAAKYESVRYDFARATIKNGKVVFIDAYQFNDVAPVTEVKDETVYYLDDSRDARVSKASDLDERVVFHDKNGYTVGKVKDIVKDDVIHFYNNYENAIVRKDATVKAKFEKTVQHPYGSYVVTKDAEYLLKFAKYLKAIYSLEGKNYFVVDDRHDLRLAIEDDVKILLALDNSVQLVESAKSWKDGIYAVNRIRSNGEVQLLPSSEDAFWAKEGRNTYYFEDNKILNNYTLQNAFEYGDIVYYEGAGEEEIGCMGVILGRQDYMLKLMKASINYRYIQAGNMQYRHFENLHAYSLNKNNELTQVKDINKFIEDNKNNTLLRAYVLSEGEFARKLDNLDIEHYKFLSNNDGIASVVIFQNAVNKTAVKEIYAVAKDKYAALQNKRLTDARFVDADGKEYVVNLLPSTKDFGVDDIVLLELVKETIDNKDKVLTGRVADVVIPSGQTPDRLVKVDGRNTFKIGTKEVYMYSGTTIFNNNDGDYAQVYYLDDAKTYLEVVRFVRPDDVPTLTILTDVKNNGSSTSYITVRENGYYKSYTVDPRTEYTRIVRDMDGRMHEEFVGRGYAGLAIFETMFLNGEVEVVADRYNNASKVIGKKGAAVPPTAKEQAKANLKKAEDIVKGLATNNEIVFPSTETKSEREAYVSLIIDELKKAGLFSTDANGAENGKIHLNVDTNNPFTVKVSSREDATLPVVTIANQKVTKLTAAQEEQAKNDKRLPELLALVSPASELTEAEMTVANVQTYVNREIQKTYPTESVKVTAVTLVSGKEYKVAVEYGSTNVATGEVKILAK